MAEWKIIALASLEIVALFGVARALTEISDTLRRISGSLREIQKHIDR